MFSEEAKRLSREILAENSEIDFRIRTGTEMYRKGFGHFLLTDAAGKELPGATVRLKQKTHEYKFGCNAFMIDSFPEKEQNERYEEVFASLFNLAVVPFYWSDLEPEPGKVRFARESSFCYRRPAPDRVLEFCEKHGITPKGHPLCWHLFWPEWIPNNTVDNMRFLRKRIEQIAARYKDRIPIWDVVNEAQSRHPACRTDIPVFPDDYVERVFRMAERFLPDCRKLYNDDNTWWNWQGDYSPSYRLIRRLQERGCSVDGIGVQYHMFENMLGDRCCGVNRPLTPRCILKCLDQYRKLDIPVNFSEVSIISRRDLGDGDTFQELVAEKLYRLWFSHPATEAIIYWNLIDDCALSRKGWDENYFKGGLVHFDMTPKKAYGVLESLIRKEWHTEGILRYDSRKANRFRGFYGRYKLEIRTDSFEMSGEINLSRNGLNRFEIAF